ncbi:hypothetical protein [Embleya sp. NBC_00896]|uniref:hypothetical protein n=1 Tax=Embleya sp. NBC_00896 TaxID=2975961 RepID=UPI002F90FD50|nr:hypothetical protein OG928_46510 [Embleya sp. NBC_00896]
MRHDLARHTAEQYTASGRASGLNGSSQPRHPRPPARPALSDSTPKPASRNKYSGLIDLVVVAAEMSQPVDPNNEHMVLLLGNNDDHPEREQSGLPSKLTRHGDAAKSKQNGDRACPGGDPYIRPPGYECERVFVPFHGGGRGDERYTVRPAHMGLVSAQLAEHPDGQQLRGPRGVGRCNIPEGQNDKGGAALRVFYGNERVLAGDRFNVGAGT